MTRTSWLAWRNAIVAFIIFSSVTAIAHGASEHAAPSPLDKQELDAVVVEIEAMVKTNENKVPDFVVKEATPSRIDRLFHTPDAAHLPKTIRENAMIFAGRGADILTFDKPSDVIGKISLAFPDEVAAARTSKAQRFFGFVHLYGPYENWATEQMAFLTLWNCMPQSAWLKPGDNPFMRRLNDGGLTLLPISARQSSNEEFDFGFCVRERSGYRPGRTMAEHEANMQKVHEMGERVTSVLQEKFARFLQTNRCRGSGPDDCVLVLHLWSGLSPSDSRLATTIQLLEADIMSADLPPFSDTSNILSPSRESGERRFDEALRRAAFLRAKLRSVLHAQSSWPQEAIAVTLHQMTELAMTLADPFVRRWYDYELDYRNDPINPWLVLPPVPHPAIRGAIMAELQGIPENAPCEAIEQWFKHVDKSLQTMYTLKQLAGNRMPRCTAPDWTWLRQDSEAARIARNDYLALLDAEEFGITHEMLLTIFTDNGMACFDKSRMKAGWLRDLCKKWISEPQAVKTHLRHSRLVLRKSERFLGMRLPPLPASVAAQNAEAFSEQDQWLLSLVPEARPEIRRDVQKITAELRRRKALVTAATGWRHPRSNKSLIELRVSFAGQYGESEWPFIGSRVLVELGPQGVKLVGVPSRFAYQYDDGEIAYVSDLDKDGNLEVWFSGEFGECDDPDAKPGKDCAITVLHMGEIHGDALTFFSAARK